MKKTASQNFGFLLATFAILSIWHGMDNRVSAQPTIKPYSLSANSVTLAAPAILKLDPTAVNMLAPNLGTMDSNLKPDVRNHMILWAASKKAKPCQVEWTVDAPTDDRYGVVLSLAGKGSGLSVSCNAEQLNKTVSDSGWHRIELGDIALKAGQNKVRLNVTQSATSKKPLLISAMELARPTDREALLKDALSMRQQSDWFKTAGYGLMFQWTNRATPPKGPIKNWEQKVNDFDLDQFVEIVDDSGASYVIWSVTWGNQYISAPVKSLDNLIAGRTTQRDLLAEMAERLHAKGIRLIFYYHYGYECYHSQDVDWLKACGGYEADKSKLFANVTSIISELGARYGDKLDGWWFDGGARYLNCHFDGSSGAEGILTAPFKTLTQASRIGNPNRMVAYNSWIKPRVTEYQDYYGGEGKKSFKPNELDNGIFKSGRQQGLQAHGCFPLERRWGHIDLNSPIAPPKYKLKQLTGFVEKAKQNGYPLSINLEMYEDGSVSPASLSLLKQLKASVAGPDKLATTQPTQESVAADKFPGEKTDFRGFDCYQFKIADNRVGVKIVCPKKAAPGKPWLWRSLFWEAIKRVSNADLKLVEEGYHVVLVHGDVAGHPSGNANIDAAYELLTSEYGFAKTCSMSSMSRGNLSLFRWAAANPEKVNSIYVDNGVCNIKSWPAGKLVPGSGSVAKGAPKSWANFKKRFGYATDEEALASKQSPIDQLEPLAKAGVPILMVCGSKDSAVPYEENDAIMEQRYKALGGNIKVIVEEKGHSHGMKDPAPVIEFIKTHTQRSLKTDRSGND